MLISELGGIEQFNYLGSYKRYYSTRADAVQQALYSNNFSIKIVPPFSIILSS